MAENIIRYFKSGRQPLSFVCGRGVSRRFPMHRHQTLSVGMVLQGSRMLVVGRNEYVIARGDIFIINPGEAHAIGSTSNPEHDYIVVSAGAELVARYAPELPRYKNIVESAELGAVLSSLFHALIDGEPNGDMSGPEKLFMLLEPFAVPDIEEADDARFSKIRHLLDTSITENYSLETLASKAYLSVFHFSRLFKHYTGLAPHRYLLDNRIRAARQMLEKGQSVSDVAIGAGFYDTSHFIRHFEGYYGVSPLEYQKGIHRLPL